MRHFDYLMLFIVLKFLIIPFTHTLCLSTPNPFSLGPRFFHVVSRKYPGGGICAPLRASPGSHRYSHCCHTAINPTLSLSLYILVSNTYGVSLPWLFSLYFITAHQVLLPVSCRLAAEQQCVNFY